MWFNEAYWGFTGRLMRGVTGLNEAQLGLMRLHGDIKHYQSTLNPARKHAKTD
jgi:hypothetical protein